MDITNYLVFIKRFVSDLCTSLLRVYSVKKHPPRVLRSSVLELSPYRQTLYH